MILNPVKHPASARPYKIMKNYFLFVVVLVCCTGLFAENPSQAKTAVFNWDLFWSGSWEDSKNLYNRGEIKLNFLPPGLNLRIEVLDKRTLNFDLAPPKGESWNAIWGDPEKTVTNFLGGLYHKSTGSRLLFGVLDEWGLSARIRNPWIRSPPYAENYKPLIVDIKTTASTTKNDEVYLYLSSPSLSLTPNIKVRSFVSAQTEIENFTPAFASGADFVFAKKTSVLLEVFYTGAALPPVKVKSWFSNPPPLPERDFKLYAAGLLFHNPLLSVSSDIALSETFAWGTDIYGNIGVSLTPLLPFGTKSRPLSFSVAADGAGERFIYRDGAAHGKGFRTAIKIELKGMQNSLLRLNTTLRSSGLGEDFNRSSTGFYYRFPAINWNKYNGLIPVRFTKIQFTMARNAENPEKIYDSYSGHIGFSVNLKKIKINKPLGINISGSINGISSFSDISLPYPVSFETWVLENAGISCEFIWSPSIFQFSSKTGYTNYVKKDNKWDFSFGSAVRFKHGRFGIKAVSKEFPKKLAYNISWRLEK
jgi:hypothetical protein